jgi:hypothetical protein
MSDNPAKPWLLGREHNPARAGLPKLPEPTDPKMFGVKLYKSDAEKLRSMAVKPSDFIRDAVHQALQRLNEQNPA